MRAMKQVLCVMLTKHEAQELYERIKGPDCFYLSTNLCPVHRSQVISEVKERLAAGLPAGLCRQRLFLSVWILISHGFYGAVRTGQPDTGGRPVQPGGKAPCACEPCVCV